MHRFTSRDGAQHPTFQHHLVPRSARHSQCRQEGERTERPRVAQVYNLPGPLNRIGHCPANFVVLLEERPKPVGILARRRSEGLDRCAHRTPMETDMNVQAAGGDGGERVGASPVSAGDGAKVKGGEMASFVPAAPATMPHTSPQGTKSVSSSSSSAASLPASTPDDKQEHQDSMPATGHADRLDEAEEYLEKSNVRFLGYASRLARVLGTKAAVMSQKARILAYSSDIGETGRPILSPGLVRALYGVTFAYVTADVANHAYIEYAKGNDRSTISRVVAQTFTFQIVCSVALPSLIIHQIMHQAESQFKKNFTNPRAIKYGPVAVGLAVIPLLPLIDHPVEKLIHAGFDTFWPHNGEKTHTD
ncbi:Uncharacterized protein FVE85_0471 [Porphyridium purpureum]|uniref:Mitochondrial fission process protein 1 n=1 Tax=Porphyridium purpureum TaxID=35688 RepID=A0A5J4Z0U0_PORPP|nr:Uncharacterized protein FVE85_0471 [Porphyridium purpureum]|eukprot:POR5552..scf208_2